MPGGYSNFQILESQGFIVGKTLGSGSHSCVRSAYDNNRKCKIAVKVIGKRKAAEDYLKKFLPREMEVLRILHHPNLVMCRQIIETTTRYFFIMDICDNGDLLEQIRKQKIISEEEAGRWMRNIIDGIEYMHGKHVVHRDIKCENLLIDYNGTLKISDFGFSKIIQQQNELSETYCGSYAYAPPEILRGIPYNAYLSDVWSMGVVLFTMVFGRLPFNDSEPREVLRKAESKLVFPAEPHVSETCKRFILKMIQKATNRAYVAQLRCDDWYSSFCSGVSVPPSDEVKPPLEISKVANGEKVLSSSSHEVLKPLGTAQA